MLKRIGIGIDVVEIDRFRHKPFDKNKRFYEKIFHNSEIEYCLKYQDPSPSFATKFAIKESVIKSINKPIGLLEIMTSHEGSKPIVNLVNDNSYHFLVSVSHEKSLAIAVVISEKN